MEVRSVPGDKIEPAALSDPLASGRAREDVYDSPSTQTGTQVEPEALLHKPSALQHLFNLVIRTNLRGREYDAPDRCGRDTAPERADTRKRGELQRGRRGGGGQCTLAIDGEEGVPCVVVRAAVRVVGLHAHCRH